MRAPLTILAVREGVIVFVGSEIGAERFVGPDTIVVELAGRTVLPAFQDVHIHPVTSGTVVVSRCDLAQSSTEEEYGIEDRTGSIEPGKLADLIVLDQNPFEIEPTLLSEVEVVLTLMEGVAVHGGFGMLNASR